MTLGKFILWAVFSLFLLPACDNKGDDYSGFSQLVSERNAARQAISEEKTREKDQDKNALKSDSKEGPPKTGLKEESSLVLYERDIQVVDSSSKKVLAKGVAYINKQGQIIKIKISSQ